MFINNYNSSFCFWVFDKRLTQENCFLFCKKYGLFNGFIFLTIKQFYCPTLQTFMVSVRRGGGGGGGGGTRSKYFIPEAELFCFSHGEGLFKEPIHK